MTKSTQKQRRDKKQFNPTELLYKLTLFGNIKLIYPDINIITLTEANDLSSKINEYTKDDNNIIIIFNNNNQINIKNVYSNYMIFKEVPNIFWIKNNIGDIAFMVVRSSKVLVYPTSHIEKSDILIDELKCILKPKTLDCLICFEKFCFDEPRVTCCNCQMSICKNCFIKYIEVNAGWCPCCTCHLIFEGIKKHQSIAEYDELFNIFISKETKLSLYSGFVQKLSGANIQSKWMSFMMSQ